MAKCEIKVKIKEINNQKRAFIELDDLFSDNFYKFAFNINILAMKKLNRIKAALADAGKTNLWLAKQVGRDPVTVSKWCTNTTQPDLQTLSKISELLHVDIRDLLVGNKFTQQS